MKKCTLKVLRDEHGFKPEDLKAVRRYVKSKEYWENNKLITDSVLRDSGLFMNAMYRGDDKELATINEAEPRIGNTPLYVHGVTKDVAVATYPDSDKGYTFALDDLTVDGINMRTYLKEGLHNEEPVQKLTKEQQKAADERRAYMQERLEPEDIVFGRGTYRNDPDTGKIERGEVVLDGKNINSFTAINELAEKLDEIDEIGTSDEHKAALQKVLKTMLAGTAKPLREMNIYLNDKGRDNGGTIDIDKEVGINIAKGSRRKEFGNDMSLIEILVHELVHGSSGFGMENRSPEITKQLELLKELREAVMKELTVEDMMGDVTMNPEVSRQIAERRIKYMNDDLREFLAYALTHEGVINKLKTITIKQVKDKYDNKEMNVFERILAAVKTMFDAALKAFGKEDRRTVRGDKLAMKLLSDIAKVNQRAELEQKTGAWAKLGNTIDDVEAKTVEWLDKSETKAAKNAMEIYKNKGKKNLWDMMKIMWLAAATEEGTPIMQSWLTGIGRKPEGFVQTVIRHMKRPDATGNRRQELTLMAAQIETKRKATIDGLTKLVSKVFKKKLTKGEKVAVYASMEVADGYRLVNEFGKDASKLYENEAELNKEIHKLEKVVGKNTRDVRDSRSVINQAKGLAKWMTTGKGSIVQRRNAKQIVRYATKGENKELIEAVDTLASLYAIKELDKSVKAGIAKVMSKEYDAIERMAQLNRGFHEYKQGRMTEMQRNNLAKNYHREEYDSMVETRVAKISERTQMRELGFELVKKIENNGLGGKGSTLGLYRSTTNIKEAFNTSSIMYVGEDSQGRLLKEDIIAAGDLDTLPLVMKKQMAVARQKEARYEEAVRRGQEPEIDTTVIPEVDEYGVVVDYRSITSMRDKLEHMGLEQNPINTVGRNWAHESDLEESDKQNEIVWDELIGDFVDEAPMNGTRGVNNGLDYIEVSKESGVFEVKDAARILPKQLQQKLIRIEEAKKALLVARSMHRDGESDKAIRKEMHKMRGGRDVEFNKKKGFYQVTDGAVVSVVGEKHWNRLRPSRKAAIRRRLGRGHIMVRRDMILDTFGIRDLTAAEFVNGKVIGKNNAKVVKKLILEIEHVWKDIVQIFKVDMIIRMLPVIMENIVSNIMYSVQYGHFPWEIAKRQLDGVKALRDYLKSKERLTELMAELSIDPENQQLRDEQARVMDGMKTNPAMPLFDANLYSHIVEDVGLTDFKSNSRLTRMIDDKLEGTPQAIRTGLDWMFINEKTSLFQLVTKATAYSDFVARYAQYTLSKEKEMAKFARVNNRMMNDDEVEKLGKELVTQVRDAYVNYTKPDSRVLQYMNDMGMVAFTKYAIRIQKALGDMARGRPVRLALAILGQELFIASTGTDFEDPLEKSFLSRSPDSWLYTPGVSTILGNIIEPQMIAHMRALTD